MGDQAPVLAHPVWVPEPSVESTSARLQTMLYNECDSIFDVVRDKREVCYPQRSCHLTGKTMVICFTLSENNIKQYVIDAQD